jgi:hypothetical protein
MSIRGYGQRNEEMSQLELIHVISITRRLAGREVAALTIYGVGQVALAVSAGQRLQSGSAVLYQIPVLYQIRCFPCQMVLVAPVGQLNVPATSHVST